MLRLINHVQVSGTSPDQSRRGIGWGDPLLPGYWRKRIDTEIRPLLNLGVTRHLIHNPFGAISGEPMQFDQVIHARHGVKGRHTPLHYLVAEFVGAWKPIVDECRDRGGEVICYLGKAKDDPDETKLLDRKDNVEALFFRWHQCLWHPDNAGMSIGFDASYDVPFAAPKIWHLMEVVKHDMELTGRTAYCEARPHKNATPLEKWNVVCTYDFWLRSDPARHVDSARWAMPTSQIKGEIVLLLAHAWSRYKDDYNKFVDDCQQEGGTPCLSMHNRRLQGGDEAILKFLDMVSTFPR